MPLFFNKKPTILSETLLKMLTVVTSLHFIFILVWTTLFKDTMKVTCSSLKRSFKKIKKKALLSPNHL